MLRLAIKRKTHRRDDASAAQADAEFAAARQSVLKRHGWRCVDCGWKSERRPDAKQPSSLQVHHLNDDHADNSEDNLAPKCALDHAYHHIGCEAASVGGHPGMASQMRVAHAPGIEPSDLNLLQMAIGAAWKDAALGPAARAIYERLMRLTRPVLQAWGTHHAKDFAAAFAAMTPTQYEARRVDDLRIVFHPNLLQQVAQAWKQDYPLLPPPAWAELARKDSEAGRGATSTSLGGR